MEISSELRDEYRGIKLNALNALSRHKGARETGDQLMNELIELEKWMKSNFTNYTGEIRDEIEILVSNEFSHSTTLRTISDFLNNASLRVKRLVKGELNPKQIASDLRIRFEEIESPLLPSEGESRIQPRSSNSKNRYEGSKYVPRLQMLIGLLQAMEIYTDEIVITSGVNLPNMLRKHAYALVGIPKKAKEILVCNEIGQATYVSHIEYGADVYTGLNKKEIVELPGVNKIVFMSKDQWENGIKEIISKEKISLDEIQSAENLRDMLADSYDVRTVLFDKRQEDLMAFRFEGLNLETICKILRLKGDPINDTDMPYCILHEILRDRGLNVSFGPKIMKKWEESRY